MRTDRYMYMYMNGLMSEWINGQINECMDEQKNR